MTPRICFALFALPLGLIAFPHDTSQDSSSAEESPGNPPRILLAAEINAEANELVLANYRTIYIGFGGECYNHRTLKGVSLRDVKLRTVAGEELSIEEAQARIDGETAILATSWRRGVPAAYRALLTGDSLVFEFPKDAPQWEEIQDPTARMGK